MNLKDIKTETLAHNVIGSLIFCKGDLFKMKDVIAVLIRELRGEEHPPEIKAALDKPKINGMGGAMPPSIDLNKTDSRSYPGSADLGRANRAFHDALRKYPDAFEALHYFWNEGIAGVAQEPAYLLHALQDIAAKRWDENADLDDICTIAESAVKLHTSSVPSTDYRPEEVTKAEMDSIEDAAIAGKPLTSTDRKTST
jgi:hypothetical protein